LYRHRLSPFPFIPSRLRRGGLPVRVRTQTVDAVALLKAKKLKTEKLKS
jgi:hypothetical protein